MSRDAQLLLPAWIAPVRPAATLLTDHAVLVRDGLIARIGPRARLLADHPDADRTPLPGHLLVPGFVDLHTHAAMALLRGAGDDLPLQRWLRERIWPMEGRLMSEEFVHDGTLLAAWELLRGGTTCINDMYFHPEAAARAVSALGMRAALSVVVLGMATPYARDAADYLRRGLQARERLRDAPRITFTLAPHAPYSVPDDAFREIARLADELDLPIHCHVHETAQEVADGLSEHGVRPLARLDALGVVSRRLIAVHAVHLDDADLDLLAARGASVAHCPHSNLKLASGMARTAQMLARGIGLGIGTDGSASNNRLDMIAETRTAALLAKGASQDAAVFDAHRALEAATLAGARALGLDDRIGSIEPAKAADLAAVDLSDADFMPVFDPVSHLIYMSSREQVTHVWVEGTLVVRNRQPVRKATADAVSRVTGRVPVWQNRAVESVPGTR